MCDFLRKFEKYPRYCPKICSITWEISDSKKIISLIYLDESSDDSGDIFLFFNLVDLILLNRLKTKN